MPSPGPAPVLPFEIRPSPIQGLGAFATVAIPAGTRLVEYAGERLTPAQAGYIGVGEAGPFKPDHYRY